MKHFFISSIVKCNSQLLTREDEADKTEHEGKQPNHETGKDYFRYKRLLGLVLLSGVSLTAYCRRKYNLPGISILYHVDNTLLSWWYCWSRIIGQSGLSQTNPKFYDNKLRGRPPQYAAAPCKLTFDFLTLKVVSESRVTWATSMPILVFLDLSVLDLGPMVRHRRQTDVRRASSLNAPTIGAGA